jgi:catechol-2,3-dioxygenase
MNDHDPAPRPVKLAHFVLRTSRFAELVAWWKLVLQAEARHESDFLTFLTYDEEHHRLAILHSPGLQDSARSSAGLEHVAFTFADLDDLLAQYERLAEHGILPILPIHHGMTMSMYYEDPDGNQVEFQVDAMSLDDAATFMASDVFAANPLGVVYDPADILERRRGGESIETILAYTPQ